MSLSHFAAGPHRALPARHDPAAGARNRGHVANPRGCFHFLGQEMAVCRHPSPPQPIPSHPAPRSADTYPQHPTARRQGRGAARGGAAQRGASRSRPRSRSRSCSQPGPLPPAAARPEVPRPRNGRTKAAPLRRRRRPSDWPRGGASPGGRGRAGAPLAGNRGDGGLASPRLARGWGRPQDGRAAGPGHGWARVEVLLLSR